MAKAQAFGDKVKGKLRTHKKMVRYILPIKGKNTGNLRFREGMLAVPEDKEHAEHIQAHIADLTK